MGVERQREREKEYLALSGCQAYAFKAEQLFLRRDALIALAVCGAIGR